MAVVVHSSLGKKGAGNYHLVLEQDVKGGYRTVATISDRDNLPEWARSPGMRVAVIAESFKEYKLGIDTTINGQQWTAVSKENALTQDDLGITVPPLDQNKKIDTIYLPNIFLNDVYPVATIAEMLELNTTTGNAVIVADVGDGTGATYFKKNDVNPATVDDFIIIIFPGAVTSVNGQSGTVTITVAGLLSIPANLTAFQGAVANSPSIATLNSVIATINESILDIDNSIISIQEQINQIVASQGGAGVGIELYTEKEYVSGKYVEYENNGVTGIYRSVQDVPDTANPTDTEYWKLISGSVAKATQNEQEVGLDDKKYTTPKGNLEALKSWLGTGLSWDSVARKINSLISQADKIKLDGIDSNATKNDTDANLRKRSTHTGTQGISTVNGLQDALNGKLSIKGDNFIATRPGADSVANGAHLISIYNEAKVMTPGGNPLSETNRVTIILFPGVYTLTDTDLLLRSYIDIIGFGPKELIIIEGAGAISGNAGSNTYIRQIENNVILSGFKYDSYYLQLENIDNGTSIYRNLICNFTTKPYSGGTILSTFENITQSYWGFGLLYSGATFSGKAKDIYSSGSSLTIDTIENAVIENAFLLSDSINGSEIVNCLIEPGIDGCLISNTIIRNSILGGDSFYEFIIKDGVEIYNTHFKQTLTPLVEGVTVISLAYNTSDVGNPWAGTNLIANGHNTWDEEGSGTGLTPEQEAKIEALPEDINTLANKEYVETEGKKLELILNFSDPNKLTFTWDDTDDFIIDNIIPDPRNNQVATTPGYTSGDTIEAYTEVTVEVDKVGLVKVIGHFV